MTRSTKTAAAAPDPLPAGKAGPVRTVKTEPASLADLSSDDLAALLKAATAATPVKQRPAASPRVTLTKEAAAAFDRMGWKAPRVNAAGMWQPKPSPTGRTRTTDATPAYTVLCAAIQAGPIRLSDVARLWLTAGHSDRTIGAIAQQLANRTGRPVAQAGDLLQLAA